MYVSIALDLIESAVEQVPRGGECVPHTRTRERRVLSLSGNVRLFPKSLRSLDLILYFESIVNA